MQETVENLWEEDFYVIGEDVPDEPGKEFVTPTIVPLRADALGNIDKPTVVIQYKTYPMSEGRTRTRPTTSQPATESTTSGR